MSSVKFELNLDGLNELMKSGEMQGVLSEAAGRVQAAAGPGYASDVAVASYVAIAKVHPTDSESAHDNLENNTLLKSLQATGLPMQKG